MAGFTLLDLLAGNTKPGGFAGQIAGDTSETGLAALLQQAQSPSAMALSGQPRPSNDSSQTWEPGGQYPQAMPNIPTTPMPGTEAASQVKKPGFFGKGGVGQTILGGLFDGLSVRAGGKPYFLEGLQDEKQRGRDLQDKDAERRAALQQWVAQQQWKIDHPDTPEQVQNWQYFRDHPDEQAGITRYRESGAPHFGTDPTTGAPGFYSPPQPYTGAAAGPPPGFVWQGKRYKGGGNYQDPNSWEDVGGPGPSGPATFR